MRNGNRLQYVALAARNLARHRRRTIITAIAVSVGVALYVAMSSLMNGFMGESDRNLKEFEFASARIVADGYWEDHQSLPLNPIIDDAGTLQSQLKEAGIEATTRTSFRGEMIIQYDPFPEDGSLPMTFTAINPDTDSQVFRLQEMMIDGRWLQAGDEIIIGKWLADRIGAKPGYHVSISTRTRNGFRQLIDMRIVGIFETFNPQVDRHTIYMPQSAANEYLELLGAASSVYVKLPEFSAGTADLGDVESVLLDSGRNDELRLLSFQEMNYAINEMTDIKDSFTSMFLFLLSIIALVGISNTMLMSVLERQKEIGTLRALGFRNSEIRQIFMLEGAGIGLIGALGGLVLSTIFVWLLTTYGIDYSFLLDKIDTGYRIEGVLYGVWEFPVMANIAVFAVLVSGLVAYLPTRKILKKTVTECLRHV